MNCLKEMVKWLTNFYELFLSISCSEKEYQDRKLQELNAQVSQTKRQLYEGENLAPPALPKVPPPATFPSRSECDTSHHSQHMSVHSSVSNHSGDHDSLGPRRLYNARTYQESSLCSQENRTDRPISASEVAVHKLETDFQNMQAGRLESPVSISSSQPEALDFTLGSKDSTNSSCCSDGRRFNLTQGDELDVSLEHETNYGRKSPGLHLYHTKSAENLSQTSGVHNPDIKCAVSPRRTLLTSKEMQKRSKSVDNLSRKPAPQLAQGQTESKWNVVDIDINSMGDNGSLTLGSKVSRPHHRSMGSLNVGTGRGAKAPREKASPVNSLRLRSIRQKTRNAVVCVTMATGINLYNVMVLVHLAYYKMPCLIGSFNFHSLWN